MPPAKRKRNEKRNSTIEDNPRASPHRPQDLDLARQNEQNGGRMTRRQGSRNAPQQTTTQESSSANEPIPQVETPRTQSPQLQPLIQPVTSQVTETVANNGLSKPKTNDSHQFYDYEFVTEEVVESWEASGREELEMQLVESCSDPEDSKCEIIVQEILQAGTTGRIGPVVAGEVLKNALTRRAEIAEERSGNLIMSSIVSAISVLFSDNERQPLAHSNPHCEELGILLATAEIDTEFLSQELEEKVLMHIGVTSSRFYGDAIRKQTNVLYKQANYNLLREESEGFSKLVTELFTTSSREPPTGRVIEATVEKVKAMVGAFDLDVGRSLDVMLDVFASVLVKQCRFFVKFFRASQFWPLQESRHVTTGGFGGLPAWALPGHDEQDVDEAAEEGLKEDRDMCFWQLAEQEGLQAFYRLAGHAPITQEQSGRDLTEAELDWQAVTGTVKRSSSSKAAQVLGFKLRFCASSDSPDGTPHNLICLAALLIKIGFISLTDLWPHLWRSDEDMDKLREQKQKEKSEKEAVSRPGAGAKNALMSAGALADDTLPIPPRLRDQGTRASTPAKDTEPETTAPKEVVERPDQKVMLLQALLAVGALPEALFMLGKFPWMMNLVPDLPEHMSRIIHHCISKLYNRLRPLQSRPSVVHTNLNVKSLRWLNLDRDDSDVDGKNYKFYWDDWSDNVPVCQNIDDVFTLSKTLLPLLGSRLGSDALILLKLARLGKASLREDDSQANQDRWIDIVKRVLLPALSTTKGIPGTVNEIFELINLFETDVRYVIYLEWTDGKTSRMGERRVASEAVKQETRSVLKRISKTNSKPMARALASIACANPHLVVTVALKQIESYDSIADCFVEGTRYFTDLGYDVLTWALIRAMGQAGRSRIQEDGIFVSKWLTALASFAGKIYKRYYLMKVWPILQYVADQLSKGSSAELIMLEQIIISMAGIKTEITYSDTQLLAMSGGPLLQAQTLLELKDERHTAKPTAKRLIRALLDHNLIVKILVALNRVRQSCVFAEKDVPLKAVGNTYDEVTKVLHQYLELLRTCLTSDEYIKHVPSTVEMLLEYDVSPEVAFEVGRPITQKNMLDMPEEEKITSIPATNGDVSMHEAEESEEDGEEIEIEDIATTANTPKAEEMDIAVEELPEAKLASAAVWNPVLKNIMDGIQDKLPQDLVNLVGTGFYVTFWQLSLYDINIDHKSYTEEMNRQKKKAQSLKVQKTTSSWSPKQRDKEVNACNQLADALDMERKQHMKFHKESRDRLHREKDQWFVDKARHSTELNTMLMEHCFLPRIVMSAHDAYFCFRFVRILHSAGTMNFSTLNFYDLLFRSDRLTSIFFSCTLTESDNLARFFLEVLKDFQRWHSNKVVYEKEAWGSKKNLPGFAMSVVNGKPTKLLDFDGFRKLLYKWHVNLHAALISCFTSFEYMHIRNAIAIVKVLSVMWPVIDQQGRSLQRTIDKLGSSDKEDLKTSSVSLLALVSLRQKQWVPLQNFKEGPGEVTKSESVKKELKENGAIISASDSKADSVRQSLTVKNEIRDAIQLPSSQILSRGRSPSHSSAASTPLPARPMNDRAARVHEKPSDLPRRLSPPRSQPPRDLPSRPEIESRSSHRDDRERLPTRVEAPRSDSRHAPSRRLEINRDEPPSRYGRNADRDLPAQRREIEPRHDDRRHERDGRTDRDTRHDRDQARPIERDNRQHMDRDHRGQHDYPPDRNRRDEISGGRRSDRDEPSRPQTSQAFNSQSTINPERAQLIGVETDSRAGISIRGQAQDKPRLSRPQSPRRDEGGRPPRDQRDDRSDHRPDRGYGYHQATESPRNGPPRDLRINSDRPADLSHGRLEQDSSQRPPPRNIRHQDRNQEPPSGPARVRPPPVDTRPEPASQTVPPLRPPPSHANDRPPPSGPGGRQHARNDSFPPPPSTPDTSGIHPSRMQHISPVEPTQHREVRQPVQGRFNPPQGRLQLPDVSTNPNFPAGPAADRPYGNGLPTGPAQSPVSRGPPSGPHSANDTGPPMGRGRGRNQVSAVNNTLAQSSTPMQNGGPRGRGGANSRQNSISGANHFNSQMSPQASPFAPQSQHGHNTGSVDLMGNSNPNGMPVAPRSSGGGPQNRQDSYNDRGLPREDRNGPRQDTGYNNRGGGPNGSARGGYQGGQGRDDMNGSGPGRKHPRDSDGQGQYPGPGSGLQGRGGRIASESKRPRRGGQG